MDNSLILETTFLIDLEREERHGQAGPAIRFLEAQLDARLYLSFITAGELAGGVSASGRHRWEAFLAPLYVLNSTPEICWHYGRIYRHLRDNGQLIGANDLWIAATALAHAMPVVTRNVDHFRRVPGLELARY